MTAPIRIVVAEADYLAREGLVRALEAVADMDIVSICSGVRTLAKAAEAEQPDVIVTALRFPGAANGDRCAVPTVEGLRRRRPGLGVLVLGEREDAAEAMQLFDRNYTGCGFLLRDRIGNSADLTRAIREIAGGSSVLDPAAVGTLLTAARKTDVHAFERLTARENEVLGLLADAESNSAIARDLGITTRAVERHVNSIFRKLDLEDSGDLNRRVKAALLFAQDAGPPDARARRRAGSH